MKYKLLSSPGVYTPGLIAWAINGYHFDKDKPEILMLIHKTYRLPMEAAWALLNKKVDYTIEDEAVIFEV